MSGPPKDVEASELFLKLQERPRPSEVIDYPRLGPDGEPVGTVRIQVLTMTERQAALRRALAWCKKQNLDKDDLASDIVQEGIYGAAVAREILAIACVSEKDWREDKDKGVPLYTRIFANGSQVDDVLTPDELATLFTAYTLTQKKFGPYASDIETEAELNAWIRKLAEGGSAAPLAWRDSAQLVDLLQSLVARVYTLSLVLESLSESLPNSLASELQTWGIGTGYFGSLLESDTDTDPDDLDPSSAGNPDSHTSPDPATFLMPDNEPVTLDKAKLLAARLLKQ